MYDWSDFVALDDTVNIAVSLSEQKIAYILTALHTLENSEFTNDDSDNRDDFHAEIITELLDNI